MDPSGPVQQSGATGASSSSSSGGGGGSVRTSPPTEAELAAMTEDEQIAYAMSLFDVQTPAAAEPASSTTSDTTEVLMDLVEEPAEDGGAASASASAEADVKASDAIPPYHLHNVEGSSDFVYVSPGAFMKVHLPGAKTGGLASQGGDGASQSRYDSWTLTMEIKVDVLPEGEPQSILQCHSNSDQMRGTVEAELYAVGALSIFSEMPKDIDTMLKPGRWNRVSIRYGAGKPVRAKMDSRNRGNMEEYLRSRQQAPPERKLSVFINGKLSSDMSKGVFSQAQGRFSMPKDGFLLFASQTPEAMPGTAIRYIRFDAEHLDDAGIRSAQLTSVYSQWQRERATASAEFLTQLSLKSLYVVVAPLTLLLSSYGREGLLPLLLETTHITHFADVSPPPSLHRHYDLVQVQATTGSVARTCVRVRVW
jgi:hypothetical protein